MSLYIKASCDALTDEKFLEVGPEGFTLYYKGLMHSKMHLTDGFVPVRALALLGIGLKSPTKTAEALVEADLWRKAEGGYTVGFERWSKHQTTRRERRWRRLKAAGGEISASLRRSIHDKFGWKCGFCQSPLDLTIDHIMPISAGGTNQDHNLQTLCRRCNARKKDTVPTNG